MFFNWNREKNQKLIRERGISFTDLICEGEILKKQNNTSSNHKNQLELHILYNNYVYKVPFVIEANGNVFLKTAFPSRGLTKIYGLKK
jgi:hypothetical protein